MEAIDALEEGEILDECEKVPIFDIKFHSHDAHNKYGAKILDSLRAAFKSDDEDNSKSIEFDIPKINKKTPIIINVFIVKENQKSQTDDEFDISSLFVVDATPNKTIEAVAIPSYKRSVKDILDDETAEKKKKNDEDVCKRPTNNKVCFNCLSNQHSLRDCPKQRNMKRINRSKKAFVGRNERYHNEVEQRFGHIVPGQISDNLRAALNLRKGEIPPMFYKMRKLGYPPGWLQHAVVENSGLSLISSENDKKDNKGANGISYDISKIIEFPGYNQNPGPNFYDDYKFHNVQPLSNHHMKSEFIKTLGGNVIKGYKRRKLKLLSESDPKLEPPKPVLVNTDMELDDNDDDQNIIFNRPPLPTDEPIIKPPTPPLPAETDDTDEIISQVVFENKECFKSPTIKDLEAEQILLLKKLKDDNYEHNSSVDELIKLDDFENDEIKKPKIANTPEPPKKKTEMEQSFEGTPLLKFSPFDKLPSGDNFKVGVCDVINFENLPDSIGKYEQMRDVIKKVRHEMKSAMDNDDDDEADI